MTPNDRPDDYPTNIVTEVDGVQAIVGECVICGETHYHGTTYRDPRKIPEDGYLGSRGAHCDAGKTSRDDPGEYYLVLADDAEVDR